MIFQALVAPSRGLMPLFDPLTIRIRSDMAI
jgi:hypothetical protein